MTLNGGRTHWRICFWQGMTFFLVPWLRRVTKRVLEDTVNADATVRLGMIMELCVHAAESIALVQVRRCI